MGYMGLGMQKWIYTMKPRKPYSMQRKGSYTSLPKYSKNFKLQHSSNKGKLDLTLVLFAVFAIVVIANVSKWSAYENELYKSQIEYRKLQNEKAFSFLFNSGIYRLKKNNIEGAYSEFKLAYKLFPEDKELKKYLFETLSILCKKENAYCLELDQLKF